MYFLLKMGIFHCYVSLPEGNNIPPGKRKTHFPNCLNWMGYVKCQFPGRYIFPLEHFPLQILKIAVWYYPFTFNATHRRPVKVVSTSMMFYLSNVTAIQIRIAVEAG